MAKRQPKSHAAAIAEAMKKLTSGIRNGSFDSIEISVPGQKTVRIDKAAAKRIRRNANEIISAERGRVSRRSQPRPRPETGGLFG